jgi:hypothetical protein
MKTLKVLLYILVIGAAVAGFGWFFVSQLSTGAPPDRLAGVLLSPPPGYAIAERGEMAPTSPAISWRSWRPGRVAHGCKQCGGGASASG